MATLATALVIASAWTSRTQEAEIMGTVTHYRERLMAEVATRRGIIEQPANYDPWLDAHGYAGMVALERAGDLGRTVWIGGERFYVADCRQRVHFPGTHVAEVDHATAMRWLAAGPWPEQVTVRFWPPDWSERKGQIL